MKKFGFLLLVLALVLCCVSCSLSDVDQHSTCKPSRPLIALGNVDLPSQHGQRAAETNSQPSSMDVNLEADEGVWKNKVFGLPTCPPPNYCGPFLIDHTALHTRRRSATQTLLDGEDFVSSLRRPSADVPSVWSCDKVALDFGVEGAVDDKLLKGMLLPEQLYFTEYRKNED